ncbi:MAG: OmpA family protein [Myxococcales bacterium]|nr:OmpA family protein [Myxococcales bacterium]
MSSRSLRLLPLFAVTIFVSWGCQPFFGIIPTPKEFTMKASTLPPNASTLSKDGEHYLMVKQSLTLADSSKMRFQEKEHVQIQSLDWKSTQSGNITQGAVVFTPRRKLKSIYARVIRQNGWVSPSRGFYDWPYDSSPNSESAAMYRLWFLGNITPGAVHEYLANYESTTFLHYTFYFQKDRPVQDSEFRFSVPQSYNFYARVYGGQGYPASLINHRTENDPNIPGNTIHIWTAKKIPALETEPGQPDAHVLTARVELAPKNFRYRGQSYGAGSWSEIANFEKDMFQKSATVTPSIKETTDKVTQGASDNTEKARRIYDFMHDKVRTIKQDPQMMNYNVTPAEETLRKRWGDNRAKAALYKAMLEAAGISSHIVRVRTREHGDVDPKMPTPAVFQHTINHIPSIEGGIFLDTSKQGSHFGDLSWEDQNASALSLNEGKLFQTPLTAPTENMTNRKVEMTVTPEGKVTGKLMVTFQGHHRADLDQRIKDHSLDSAVGKNQWGQGLLGYLAGKKILQGIKVKETRISDLKTKKPRVEVDFTAEVHKARTTDCEYYVHFDFHSGHQASLSAKRQHHPYLWRNTGHYIDEVQVNGLKALELPKPKSIDDALLRYQLSTSASGPSITLKAEYHFRKGVISNNDYKKLQELFVQVDGAENTLLVASTMRKGCPGGDEDGDGIPDEKDKCPKVKGIPENQGCPDKDSDGDGIVDRLDKCPFVPGVKERDGCPKVVLVKVTDKKIEILQKIFFRLNKATIQRKSFSVLDQVVAVLKSRPSIRVRIEGHTDSSGNAAYNTGLSDRRAKSVRAYLVKNGIEENRLEAIGFGPKRPLVPNTNRKNRAKNRRVEFNIISQ